MSQSPLLVWRLSLSSLFHHDPCSLPEGWSDQCPLNWQSKSHWDCNLNFVPIFSPRRMILLKFPLAGSTQVPTQAACPGQSSIQTHLTQPGLQPGIQTHLFQTCQTYPGYLICLIHPGLQPRFQNCLILSGPVLGILTFPSLPALLSLVPLCDFVGIPDGPDWNVDH